MTHNLILRRRFLLDLIADPFPFFVLLLHTLCNSLFVVAMKSVVGYIIEFGSLHFEVSDVNPWVRFLEAAAEWSLPIFIISCHHYPDLPRVVDLHLIVEIGAKFRSILHN